MKTHPGVCRLFLQKEFYVYLFVSVCVVAGAHRCQKGHQIPLELQL